MEHIVNEHFTINPYRPGAGHMPPFLAGRSGETLEFERLLKGPPILQNPLVTGIRGVGKTVLLDSFKPLAIEHGWVWVGTDLSEASAFSEINLVVRLVTDLAPVTALLQADIATGPQATGGVRRVLDYQALMDRFNHTPGLNADRLKSVMQLVWSAFRVTGKRGIIFAYDEAQNLSDRATNDQYPLSLLLDVFQSLQRQSIPFMLALAGLPTLYPRLVEARTYAERMFQVITLGPLETAATQQAIVTPLARSSSSVQFSKESVDQIVSMSAGYPYFVQYICREWFDLWVAHIASGITQNPIPAQDISRKLDIEFFGSRWEHVTPRQRDLLWAIANVPTADSEFSVQELLESCRTVLDKPFSPSHATQILGTLSEEGLVYKNRWGRYSLALPLFGEFIRRTYQAELDAARDLKRAFEDESDAQNPHSS